MSRIGKLPIAIPEGVKIDINGQNVKVSGPKGALERNIPKDISVELADNELRLTTKKTDGNALYGTTRALLANAVKGVKDGWSKRLELVGTGYRAEVNGSSLKIAIGFSHPVVIEAPQGITFKVEKSDINIDGFDKEVVGQVAAKIRAIRPPEPYKGKGIKYKDEVIRRKAGKAAKAAGGAS